MKTSAKHLGLAVGPLVR